MENRVPLKRRNDAKAKDERKNSCSNDRQPIFSEITQQDNSSWTPQEDALISDFVEAYGPRHWKNIARNLPGRTGEQCKERWLTHLNPKQGATRAKSTLYYVAPDYKSFELDETITAHKIILSILCKRYLA